MSEKKIRIGITHGDINGIGYEVILKTFANEQMLQLCTPIVYGSPKVMTYYRKLFNSRANFTIKRSAQDAVAGQLNVVNVCDDEVRVTLGQATPEAGKMALQALQAAVDDYKKGYFDVLVTAPFNKATIPVGEFEFPGHSEYLTSQFGGTPLTIMVKDDIRIALLTGHIPFTHIAPSITRELIEEKLRIFYASLQRDFDISTPRIAVLSLNPHAGVNGLLGTEEKEVISPAIKAMSEKGVVCYGPYSVDGLMGSGQFAHFDGILAMYHDQGMAPFKTLNLEDGLNFTAGLPIVRTAPAHGAAYPLAGKGEASESSFRQAVYMAIDVFRSRKRYEEAERNPLRKMYFDKRDDSDKLKLDSPDEEVL